MSFKQEAAEAGRITAWWILAAILAFGTVGAGWWVFTRPNVDRGYSAQISGLVTAYCTPGTRQEQQQARGDIIAQRDSAPARWNRLSTSARSRATQVINNDSEVCK